MFFALNIISSMQSYKYVMQKIRNINNKPKEREDKKISENSLIEMPKAENYKENIFYFLNNLPVLKKKLLIIKREFLIFSII